MSAPIERLLERLPSAKPDGKDKWKAFCPIHEDPPDGHKRSLSVKVAGDTVLVYCHSCGKEATPAILDALGLTLADLFLADAAGRPKSKSAGKAKAPAAQIVAVYDYRDSAGVLRHQVVRRADKTFPQRRPDGKGGHIWNMDGVPRLLYRLPELLAADSSAWVFVPEGEKDADNVWGLGLVATCNSGGAGKWGTLSEDSALHGRRVVVLADKDKAGREHAQDVAARLRGKAAEVRIVEMADGTTPDGKPIKDVSDWIESLDGRTPEELAAALVKMADDAPTWTPQAGALPATEAAAQEEPEHHRAALRSASSIVTRPLSWLWRPRFPSGKLSMLIGHPGQGKTLVGLGMAAHLSRGTAWPDGEPCELGNSIILSGEDDPADTLVPRLRAAGADLARISFLDGVEWRDPATKEIRISLVELDRHIPRIREAIEQVKAKYFLIDPISSFVGKIDDHRNSELRGMLAALAEVARDTGCAILPISHLRKAGGLAVHQAVGSLAYAAACRAVWAVLCDPQDAERRLLLPVKMNLVKVTGGLAFAVVDDGTPNGQPVLRWEPEPVKMHADDVLNPPRKPGPAPAQCEEAIEWLTIALADGPRLADDLLDQAHAVGIKPGTLRRAKTGLGVKDYKDGFQGPWFWAFPKDAPKGEA